MDKLVYDDILFYFDNYYLITDITDPDNANVDEEKYAHNNNFVYVSESEITSYYNDSKAVLSSNILGLEDYVNEVSEIWQMALNRYTAALLWDIRFYDQNMEYNLTFNNMRFKNYADKLRFLAEVSLSNVVEYLNNKYGANKVILRPLVDKSVINTIDYKTIVDRNAKSRS